MLIFYDLETYVKDYGVIKQKMCFAVVGFWGGADGTFPGQDREERCDSNVHFGHIYYNVLLLRYLRFPLLRTEHSFTTIQAPTLAPKTVLFVTFGEEVL